MGYLIIILIFVIVVLFLRNNQLQADNHVFKAEKNISQTIEVSEYERLVLNYQKRRSDERSALIESIWKNENPQTNKMDFDMEILSKLHNEYESVEKLQEGIARVSRKDKEGKKKYGFVDASGQLIIPLIYSYASDFKEDVAIVSPTAGSFSTNSKPTITWKLTDADSGVNPATIGITLDSGTKVTGDAITKTAITGGYQCTYTPATALSDGSHTIKLDASDYDGNAAATNSTTFKVDTVPPTLTLSSPADKLITNKSACTVKGTTNDVTSSPVKVTIKLNSGTAESVTVGRDGSFTKDLTLANGTNTITVVATDSAGKSTTVTRTVTLDTGAPVIKSVTLTPNPVDCGKTFVISVEVTD